MIKIKIKKDEFPNIVFYLLYVLFYFFTLVKFGMGNSISNLRYYFLAFFCLFSIIALLFKFRQGYINKVNYKRLLLVIPLGVILLACSFYRASVVGQYISMRTFVQTSLVVLPAIYAFCLLNNCEKKTIIFLMKCTLIVTIIAYFLESNHSFIEFFKISNWSGMTFEDNFLESSVCSGTFVQLYLFFKYYCMKDNKDKYNLKIWKNVSFIFSLICFKRLGMFFVVFIAITSNFINYNKKINSKIFFILSIVITILTYYYCQFVKGNLDLFGINVYEFTTGRNYIMKLWEKSNYFSYGYGTSMLVIGRYLEMDLIQIYMELGLAITFIFIWVYINISEKKMYSLAIILFGLAGMLFASSLPSIFTWILMFINISFLQNDLNNDRNDNL